MCDRVRPAAVGQHGAAHPAAFADARHLQRVTSKGGGNVWRWGPTRPRSKGRKQPDGLRARARWVIADSTLKALLGVHRLEALIVSTYLAPSPSVPTCSGALARVNRTPGEARLALRIVGRLRRREDAVACADMRPW